MGASWPPPQQTRPAALPGAHSRRLSPSTANICYNQLAVACRLEHTPAFPLTCDTAGVQAALQVAAPDVGSTPAGGLPADFAALHTLQAEQYRQVLSRILFTVGTQHGLRLRPLCTPDEQPQPAAVATTVAVDRAPTAMAPDARVVDAAAAQQQEAGHGSSGGSGTASSAHLRTWLAAGANDAASTFVSTGLSINGELPATSPPLAPPTALSHLTLPQVLAALVRRGGPPPPAAWLERTACALAQHAADYAVEDLIAAVKSLAAIQYAPSDHFAQLMASQLRPQLALLPPDVGLDLVAALCKLLARPDGNLTALLNSWLQCAFSSPGAPMANADATVALVTSALVLTQALQLPASSITVKTLVARGLKATLHCRSVLHEQYANHLLSHVMYLCLLLHVIGAAALTVRHVNGN